MNCDVLRETARRFGVNVLHYSEKGDDFATVMQRAFDSGERMLFLPAGEYMVARPLTIRSNTVLALDDNACVSACEGTMKRRGDFLLRNAASVNGGQDVNITIIGGTWDGCYAGNPKSDIFDEQGYSGAMMNFVHVNNLVFSGMKLRNAAAYFTRFGWIRSFLIEDITLSHEKNSINNDGIHLGGFCENGVIRAIHCTTKGTTADDLIALNADDCVVRTENRDLARGFIRNVVIEDIQAESCHCFVRMLSVTAEIGNIIIRDVRGGCYSSAINMDAARHCRTPLVEKDDPAYTRGVGNIHHVRLENFCVTQERQNLLINAESNCDHFEICNFMCAPDNSAGDTLKLLNLSPARIKLYGIKKPQLEQLLADSKLTQYTVLAHADGSFGVDITTDYYDTLLLQSGGFAYLSLDRIEQSPRNRRNT